MLDKAYNPQAVEDALYKKWEESGAFRPESCDPKGEPFTIAMPPPNATGQLHLGHAVMLALQDIFTRFARMRGKKALWLPGTDHAAIATENVVIKKLQKEGMKDPRKELGREKLVQTIAEFVEESKATIRGQVRKMGASCDWTRERYTFEPTLNRAVNEVFCKMKNDGLIYRGHRIVNWDPKLQTTVSDDELVYKEEKGAFYTFQYGPFQIGTARPETKFGDKYVVMHPKDKRYSKFKHGDSFDAEWINGPVRATVIKDESIDMEFGTGVMTITPWHDHTDFEIAERHGLEKEQIIDFHGRLLDVAGEFKGMKIDEARPLIVGKLASKGLLVKTDENYVHNKAVSQRGGGSIEPQIKLQWFIDVKKQVVPWKGQKMSLKEIMHDVIHHGDIKIIPDRFNKTYFHWIDNLRDWCISRQIWWGHRVPVWYCGKCVDEKGKSKEVISGEWLVASTATHHSPLTTNHCPDCGSSMDQDSDTLDTWFSSAMWTWSTLLDPQKAADPALSLAEMLKSSPDFQKFHPTSVMETGYDILFFWVARMILMTTYATGQIPFKTVYLHGLIRTRDGRKMSKSDPDTMIDPLDMIAKYGADALRLSMIVGQSPGNDSRLYEEKIAGYRNFINKLWNASRFVLMQCEEKGVDPKKVVSGQWSVDSLSLADRALLHSLQTLIADVTSGLETYDLSATGDRLYSFVWDFFCDWYLELSKGEANPEVLVHALRTILQLLHPYCPFVTEELWSHVGLKGAQSLIAHPWPKEEKKLHDESAFADLHVIIETVTAIRRLRAENDIEAGKKITVFIHSKKQVALLTSQQEHLLRMTNAESLTIDAKSAKHENAASAFLADIEIHLSLAGLFDPVKLKASLLKEQADLSKYVTMLKGKLSNNSFTDKAPQELVDAEKQKLEAAEEKLKKIEERLLGITG
ncbi:MAG: valine--tRNA ligase [Candidatus Peribacteraceae bacterium]